MTFASFVGNSTSGIVGLLNTIVVPVIFSLAFLTFVWGIVKYFFLHGTEESGRQSGRQFIIWGLLGMVVLFSVWSFVRILLSTLGFM